MNFLFFGIIFLTALFRTFRPGPESQLIGDILIVAGLFFLPVFWRKKGQGAEFLTSSGPSDSSHSFPPDLFFPDVPFRTHHLRLFFLTWAVLLVLLYYLSIPFSYHTGSTLSACRQVTAGFLIFGIMACLRFDSDPILDLLLGIGWLFWLILFLHPLWQKFFPALWRVVDHPFSKWPSLSGENSREIAVMGIMGLETWLVSVILITRNFRRTVLAIVAHTLLWTLWGGIGSYRLLVLPGISLIIIIAGGPNRLKHYWTLALITLVVGIAGWWIAHAYFPLKYFFGISYQTNSEVLGSFAQSADWEAAAYRFPFGVGALAHPWIRSIFSAPAFQAPVPGGQYLLWTSDLGLFGLFWGLFLMILLVASIRFIERAYQDVLESSRDPKTLQTVKESDYSILPAMLPATLLSWLAATFVLKDLDLFLSPVFWIYLGLWLGWLSGRPAPEQMSSHWHRRIRKGSMLIATLLFLLLGASREMGRFYYRQALANSDFAQQQVSLRSAQFWEPWNSEYSFRMARIALDQGQSQASRVLQGLRMAEQGLRWAPGDAEGHMLESRLMRADGRIYNALAAAEKAVFFAPHRADFRWELGGLYESVGRLEAAGGEYSVLLNLDPLNVKVHLALARLAEKNNRYEEALEIYRKVLLLDRQEPTALSRYHSLKEQIRQEPI